MLASHARYLEALNVLKDNIVILDANGIILFVNKAWRQFAKCNRCADGSLPRNIDVGSNYLSICRTAAEKSADEISEVCTGIRSVLDGRKREFICAYPCSSPETERWFEMTVRPLPRSDPQEAIIIHSDVTRRWLSEQKAQRQQSELSAALSNLSAMAGKIKHSLDQEMASPIAPRSGPVYYDTSIKAQQLLNSLSEREQEVLGALVRGQRNGEIAAALNLSPKSISTYRMRILNKFNLNSDAELISFLTRNGQL